MKPIGILGGTFDPIHFGHLRTGLEVLTALEFAELRFIPSALPPHRAAPLANPELRWRLVTAACAGQEGFIPDDRELKRSGPSFMVDTLTDLRREFPATPLALVLGMDAFLGLPGWHRWQEILDLAHVVVMGRPGFARSTPGPLAGIVEARESTGREALHAEPAGRVLFQEVTRLDISSSAIRSLLAQGGDPRFLVPEAVRAILLQSGCYRSDSTHDRPGAAGPSPRLFKEDRARAK